MTKTCSRLWYRMALKLKLYNIYDLYLDSNWDMAFDLWSLLKFISHIESHITLGLGHEVLTKK